MPSQQKKIDVDLAIVGAGPAGTSCAIQARRDGFSLVLIGDEAVGGLLRAARRLDNFPARPGLSGTDLAADLARHIESLGIDFVRDRAHACSFDERSQRFELRTDGGFKIASLSLCLATGTRPLGWDISKEDKAFHRDSRTLPGTLSAKSVAVVGSGEAALDTALTAKDRGALVSLMARGQTLHASKALLEEIRSDQIGIHLQTQVMEAEYSDERWTLETTKGAMEFDELVVCIGREPNLELLGELMKAPARHSIEQSMRPGLFMAGDIIRGRDRYTATAIGDGQRAAILAGKYIKEANKP